MKTLLRKTSFDDNQSFVEKYISKNEDLLRFDLDTFKENQEHVDLELIVDQDNNVYDVRLFDPYHYLCDDYVYGDGWTNWLFEWTIEGKEYAYLRNQYDKLTQ